MIQTLRLHHGDGGGAVHNRIHDRHRHHHRDGGGNIHVHQHRHRRDGGGNIHVQMCIRDRVCQQYFLLFT